MTSRADTKTRLTDRKRAAILDAAIIEFISNGFDSTSMDQIALRASASKTTVYNHFPGKDDLFEAIIDELVARADIFPECPYDPNVSIGKQLNAIGLAITNAVSDPTFQSLAKIVFSRLISAPKYGSLLAKHTHFLDAKFADWLRAAHRDQRLKITKPTLAAEQFIGTLLSYSLWVPLVNVKRKPDRVSQREYVKECVKRFQISHAV